MLGVGGVGLFCGEGTPPDKVNQGKSRQIKVNQGESRESREN